MVAGTEGDPVALVPSGLGGFWCSYSSCIRRPYYAGLLSGAQS